jgi:hypothetical protein
MYIDRLVDSDFLPKVEPGHIDTLKTYIDVLSGYKPNRVVVLFTYCALSGPLSMLKSNNGTAALIHMFYALDYRPYSQGEKFKLHDHLAAWSRDHPDCNRILVESMLSRLST